MPEIYDSTGSARVSENPDIAPFNSDAEQNKAMGIIAYLGIFFLVPLLAAKESRFAMYHANQGLVLFLFGIAVGAIVMIPILGWIVGFVGGIAHLVFAIMGIINAAKGEMKPLPLIGNFNLIHPPSPVMR